MVTGWTAFLNPSAFKKLKFLTPESELKHIFLNFPFELPVICGMHSNRFIFVVFDVISTSYHTTKFSPFLF